MGFRIRLAPKSMTSDDLELDGGAYLEIWNGECPGVYISGVHLKKCSNFTIFFTLNISAIFLTPKGASPKAPCKYALTKKYYETILYYGLKFSGMCISDLVARRRYFVTRCWRVLDFCCRFSAPVIRHSSSVVFLSVLRPQGRFYRRSFSVTFPTVLPVDHQAELRGPLAGLESWWLASWRNLA